MWYAKVVCEVFDCGRRAQQLSVTSAEYTYISPACRGGATHACEMAAPKPAGNKKATEPPKDIPAAKNSGGSRAVPGQDARPEKLGLGAANVPRPQEPSSPSVR